MQSLSFRPAVPSAALITIGLPTSLPRQASRHGHFSHLWLWTPRVCKSSKDMDVLL